MATKLIMIEGLPGSGKTSTASFIAEYLQTHGVKCESYFEGDLDHPADYESVACVQRAQFEAFLRTYPESEDVLRTAAVSGDNGRIFIPYGKLAKQHDLPEELAHALSQLDVYELPSDAYCDALLKRWTKFADRHERSNTVFIFECCFLQNPMCQLFVRNNESREYISQYLHQLSRAIQKLDPILIYLNPLNVNETIHKVSLERSREWLDFVVWYHTEQGYGRERGVDGVNGYVEVLRARQALELSLLKELPIHTVQIDDPQIDWTASHRKIKEHVGV